jgi:hypothetical protein
MKQPGLDDRHRDEDGTIRQKRSDTLNKNLPKPVSLSELAPHIVMVKSADNRQRKNAPDRLNNPP